MNTKTDDMREERERQAGMYGRTPLEKVIFEAGFTAGAIFQLEQTLEIVRGKEPVVDGPKDELQN